MRTESRDKLTKKSQSGSAKIIERSKNIYSSANFHKRPHLDKSTQPKSFESSHLLSDHSQSTEPKTFSSTNIDNVPLIYTKLTEKNPDGLERQNSPSITSRLFNLLKPKQAKKADSDTQPRNDTPNFQNGLFKQSSSSLSKDTKAKINAIPQIYQQTKQSNSTLSSPFRIPVPLQLGSCSPVKMSVKNLDTLNLNNFSKTSIKSNNDVVHSHLYSIPSTTDDKSMDPPVPYKPFSMNPSPKSKKGNSIAFQFKKGESSAQYRSKVQDHESSKLSLSDKPNKEIQLKSSFLKKATTLYPTELFLREKSQKDDLLFKSIQLDSQPAHSVQVFNSNGRKDNIGRAIEKNKPNLFRQLSNPNDVYNNSSTHNAHGWGSTHQGQIEALQSLNKRIMDKAKKLQQAKHTYV
jgi:hypothetical protein